MERWLGQETPSRESSVGRGLERSDAYIRGNTYFEQKWPGVEGKEEDHEQALEEEHDQQVGRLAGLHDKLLELSRSPKLPDQRQRTISGVGNMLKRVSDKGLQKKLDEVLNEYGESTALEDIEATRSDYTDPLSEIGLDRQAMLAKLMNAKAADASLTDRVETLSDARRFIIADRGDIASKAKGYEEGLNRNFNDTRAKLIGQAEIYARQYQTHIDNARREIGED